MRIISNAALGGMAGMLMLSASAGAAASEAKSSSHVVPGVQTSAGKKQAASSLPTGTCDWAPGDNTPMNGSQSGNLRYGYVDLTAGYYGFVISPAYPTGTTFRLNGQFPDARYMSFQMYDGQVQDLFEIPDYNIVPDAGGQNPSKSPNFYDRSVPYGSSYTLHIIVGPAPATLPPNTFYIDPSQFGPKAPASFVYRIYNPFDGVTVAEHGNVPIPSVVEETPKGDVPIGQLQRTLACDTFLGLRNAERLFVAESLDILEALPVHPNPIPPKPVPPPPVFAIYYTTPGTWLVNDDNRYMYINPSQKLGDLVLMRGKAPTWATMPGGNSDPQVRHWSMCENSQYSFETYACIQDSDAVLDADGFFNIVMSVDKKKPANATHAYGFDWLTWGTTTAALPIFRHMLPSTDFTQSAFNVPEGVDPATIMGDYDPVATYCANSVFSAHTNNHETPAQVFAACQAGQ